MNIDLRNVSQDFENSVNELKIEFGFSTNSKVVEHCTVNYMKQRKLIEKLEKILTTQRNELDLIKKDVKTFTGSLSRLTQIT